MSKDQIQYGPNASLDGHDVDLASADRLIESLRQQLEASQKREVMLRDVMREVLDAVWLKTSHELARKFSEALAATADLSGYILCEKEPVAEFILDELPVGSVKLIFHSGGPLYNGENLYRAWEPK